MKKILFIGGLGVFLVVAVIFGLKFFEIGPFAKSEEKTDGPVPLKSVFIKLKQLTIPIINGNEIVANLNINITIETKVPEIGQTYQGSLRERNEKQKELEKHKLEKLMPQIENMFISDLHSFIPRFFQKYDGIDDKVLSLRLLAIANKQVEKDLIYKVSTISKIEILPD